MLTNLIAALEPLAQTHAIHLVAGSIAAGLVLLILPGDALLGAIFLLQRAAILLLLWPRLPRQLVASSAVASLAVGLIYAATALSFFLRRRTGTTARSRLLRHLPSRIAAAALALLLASAAARATSSVPIPQLMLWMVAWLVVQSAFSLLLAASPLQTGIGALAFADAGRILYALLRPDALLWGAWAACDVLIALGVARLAINTTVAPDATPPAVGVAPPAATPGQQPDLSAEQPNPTPTEEEPE
ncbi:MAG TPA: hypothetical protein PKJ21_06275 [Anaerolineae bacterium]|nr:hypothetical protein [Anaerolineae bacterium]HNT05764.1 hypothetical protein [Anaerolineae bacterium]